MLPHKRYNDGFKRGYYTYKLHAYRAIKKTHAKRAKKC